MQQQYEPEDNVIIVKVPKAYYEKDGTEREKTPTDPDKKGGATIDGKEYWASAWESVSKKGEAYTKVKLTPKQDSQGTQYRQTDKMPVSNLAEAVQNEVQKLDEQEKKPKQQWAEDDDVPF